jgi:predicted dehydrogenase
MNALLVGAGGMGQTWAKNLVQHRSVSLTGWVDVRPGAAEEAAERLEIRVEHFDTDLERALDSIKPDFVVDVTPPEFHYEVTLASLARGVPVLGEKPMAATMEQARAMVAAADRAQRLYMVSQSRRYNSQLVAFKKFVQARLGCLGILNADFYIGAHFGGFRDDMESPLVLDMAIHTFDEARFITGVDAVSVYAEEFNPSWSWYRGDASASALFELDRGVRFNYRGSWCAEGCHTSWDADWRAVGEHGTAIWQENTTPFAEIVRAKGGFFSEMENLQVPVEPITEGIAGSLEEFLQALQTGESPNGECHDNIKSLAMVQAVTESSRLGSRVMLRDLL